MQIFPKSTSWYLGWKPFGTSGLSEHKFPCLICGLQETMVSKPSNSKGGIPVNGPFSQLWEFGIRMFLQRGAVTRTNNWCSLGPTLNDLLVWPTTWTQSIRWFFGVFPNLWTSPALLTIMFWFSLPILPISIYDIFFCSCTRTSIST